MLKKKIHQPGIFVSNEVILQKQRRKKRLSQTKPALQEILKSSPGKWKMIWSETLYLHTEKKSREEEMNEAPPTGIFTH